jgi:hypothetical protein
VLKEAKKEEKKCGRKKRGRKERRKDRINNVARCTINVLLTSVFYYKNNRRAKFGRTG